MLDTIFPVLSAGSREASAARQTANEGGSRCSGAHSGIARMASPISFDRTTLKRSGIARSLPVRSRSLLGARVGLIMCSEPESSNGPAALCL